MKGFESRKRWYGAVSVTLIGASLVLSAPLSARAATVATDFSEPTFQNGQQLSDYELAQLRGKAVNGRQVLFFGVEMSMNWKSPAGEEVHARADLGIDMANGQPSPTFTSHITATTPEQYAAYRQAMSDAGQVVDAGSSNAKGVVQLVQAGGDFNSANNRFWIDVGQDVGRGSVSPGNNEQSLETPAGAHVAITKQAGSLGMTLDIPGTGRASQEILSRRGLHQSIQLSSSHQTISNMTRLRVQLGEASSAKIGQDVKRMLQSVRGLDHLRQ
ncbi:MAG: hypothetical protein ACQEUG_05520 [Pseudomonadota bacterium]